MVANVTATRVMTHHYANERRRIKLQLATNEDGRRKKGSRRKMIQIQWSDYGKYNSLHERKYMI
jgi:hypothetical protein